MSTDIDWWVQQFPTRDELDETLRSICGEVGLSVDAFQVRYDERTTRFDVGFDILTDDLDGVHRVLGDARGWSIQAFREWLDAPERAHRWPESGRLRLSFSISAADDDDGSSAPAAVVLDDGFDDNRVAWPVAELLAVRVAELIGIHADDYNRDA